MLFPVFAFPFRGRWQPEGLTDEVVPERGDLLLSFACDKIREFQLNMGGKMAYLECRDVPGLVAFYERNGFFRFANRNLDGDEIGEQRYLVQMIRYFSGSD